MFEILPASRMLVVEVSEVASCIMGGQKVIMRLCEARAEEDSDDLVPVFKVFVNGLARPDLETERFLRQPRRESSSLTWLLFTSPAQPNMDNLPSDAKVKLTVMVRHGFIQKDHKLSHFGRTGRDYRTMLVSGQKNRKSR